MRKKAALAVALGAFLLVGGLPGVILGRVDRCPVTSPQLVSYRPSIRCEGQVCPAEGYELLSSGLYRVEERYRALGDPVGKGEALATLVPAAGEAVLYLQTQGSGIPGEIQGGGLEAILKSYGGTEARTEELFLTNWTAGEESKKGERVPVTSPAEGVVTREAPVPGSVLRPGDVIASVEGRGEYYALVTVGEKDAAKISVGDQAVLSGEGIGQGSCEGSVTRIRPGTRKELSGAVTRNVVDVEVSFQPGEREIRPGFSIKAQIFTDVEKERLMIPYESVRQDLDNTEYVMVAGACRLEKRPITTGQETAEGVEVLEGLRPDELVALLPEDSGEEEQRRYLLVYTEGG